MGEVGKPKAGMSGVYDEWYRSGKAHWGDAPGKAVLVAALRACCPAERKLKLLDIGCGNGPFLARIRAEVSPHWEMHGIDFSQVAIDEAKRMHPDFHFICADATKLDYPDGSLDIVVCYGSWEHFKEPARAIADTARVLAPSGWVFAMIPALGVHRTDRDDEGWYEDTEVAGCDQRQLQWNYRRSTWEAMFDTCGLQLAGDSLALRCGAQKPGVFFFGTKLAGAHAELPTGGAWAKAAPYLLDLATTASISALKLAEPVEKAAQLLCERLASGGKVLACGNGGSAADAQHFVAELVGRMARERRALPGISLSSDPSNVTALANDYGFERVFARQVEALGAPGDVLLGITTSGRSPNVLRALETARSRGLTTILLVGAKPPEGADVCISIPSQNAQRVQEIHIAVLHALCERIERHFCDESAGSNNS